MTNETTLRLPRSLVNLLLEDAQAKPGEEVCGLVGARDGEPVSVYPVANRLHAPFRFAMDEAEQIAAFRAMRERGEHLYAIYHSHPAAKAFPSHRDLTEAAYREALYLIISLNTKGLLEMRAFRLEGDHFMELPLGIREN